MDLRLHRAALVHIRICILGLDLLDIDVTTGPDAEWTRGDVATNLVGFVADPPTPEAKRR